MIFERMFEDNVASPSAVGMGGGMSQFSVFDSTQEDRTGGDGTAAMNDDIAKLRRALWNEKASPEILAYEEEAVEDLKELVDHQVCFSHVRGVFTRGFHLELVYFGCVCVFFPLWFVPREASKVAMFCQRGVARQSTSFLKYALTRGQLPPSFLLSFSPPHTDLTLDMRDITLERAARYCGRIWGERRRQIQGRSLPA